MHKGFAIFIAGLVISNTPPAAADCLEEIKSMFNGGAWDPFVMENRRATTVLVHPDGSKAPYSDVLWDGPFRSINCTPNGCFMAIGNSSWTGSSFEGPWKKSGNVGTVDPETFVRGTRDRLAASVTEPECSGNVDLGGKTAILYHFYSKPEPNEYGSWWGGRYSIWLDSTGKRMLRMELADGIASWAPKPSKDVQATTILYDESIEIKEPQ